MSEAIHQYKLEAEALGLDKTETQAYFRSRIMEAAELALKEKRELQELAIKAKAAEVQLQAEIKAAEVKAQAAEAEAKAAEAQLQLDLEIKAKAAMADIEQKSRAAEADIEQKSRAAEAEIELKNFELQSNKEIRILELQSREKISFSESNERLESIRLGGESRPTGSGSSSSLSTTPTLNHYAKLLDLAILKSEQKIDIDAYLTKFKRLCVLNSVPVEFHGRLLASKLGGSLVEIFNRIPIEDANKFEVIEAALLQRFMLDSDHYSNLFKTLTSLEGESASEFFRRLRQVLERWLLMEKTENSFPAIVDFMLTDQYISRLRATNKHKLVEESQTLENHKLRL